MMVAIMMPSLLPTVLLFKTVSQSRPQASPLAVFVFGYFVIWIISGLAAFLIQAAGSLWQTSSLWVGIGLLVAGAYQFTRLKNQCLVHCRSPLDFFMHHWSDGTTGAFRMGLLHGAYCIGCCWGLMIALLVLGMMNPLWMFAAAGVIALEKHFAAGERVAKITGFLFILFGAYWVLVAPQLIMDMGGM